MTDDPRERIGRRGFLGAAGAGALGLSGCIDGDEPEPVAEGGDGGDGGDAAELRMRTATSMTAAYTANQGLAAAVNENTDSAFLALTNAGTASRLPIPTRNQP